MLLTFTWPRYVESAAILFPDLLASEEAPSTPDQDEEQFRRRLWMELYRPTVPGLGSPVSVSTAKSDQTPPEPRQKTSSRGFAGAIIPKATTRPGRRLNDLDSQTASDQHLPSSNQYHAECQAPASTGFQ